MNTLKDRLAAIRIVMVNTTLPANIGSAARAMHTMGLSQLTVVDPKHPIDDTSYAHAAGATAILDAATVAPTLDEALADCQLVFAASSRSRHMPRPVVTPAQSAQLIQQFLSGQSHVSCAEPPQAAVPQPSSSPKPNIAIIFGREDRGLTNEELAHASYHIQITANPDYPVLNVASAVQVIASFIFDGLKQYDEAGKFEASKHLSNELNQANQPSQPSASPETLSDTTSLIVQLRQEWDEPAITHQQQQQLNQKLLNLMISLDLADADDPKLLPQRLSRLTSRLQLDQKEHQLINSILGKLNSQR